MVPVNGISNCLGQQSWSSKERPENEVPVVGSRFVPNAKGPYGFKDGCRVAKMESDMPPQVQVRKAPSQWRMLFQEALDSMIIGSS